MPFNFEKIRSILVCPGSRAELVHSGDHLISTDPEHRLQYLIVDEIPRLIVEEAVMLDLVTWSAIMEQHGRDAQTGRTLQTT